MTMRIPLKHIAQINPSVNLPSIGEIEYLPMEMVKKGSYVRNKVEVSRLPKSLVSFAKGDIVVAKVTPCFENGNIAHLEELTGGVGLGSSELIVVRANQQIVRAEYLFYLLQESHFKSKCVSMMRGTGGLKRVQPDFFANYKHPVPNLDIQNKVVKWLNTRCAAIDRTIATKQALLERLEEYKKAVITKAATKGLDPNVNMKDSGIPWIGEIPSNWQIVKVKQVTSLVTDGAHVAPETENGVYDFVSTVDIDNDTIDFNSCLKTSESSYEYLVATKCKPNIGDVLISKDGTVGKTVVVKDDRNFVVASSLVILRPKVNLVMPYFLNYALQSNIVQETLASLMHGAGLKRVSVEKNANLQIVLPPIGEQQEIISFLDEKCSAINCLISKEQETIKKLSEYRSSLISAAVTGKIDVTEH